MTEEQLQSLLSELESLRALAACAYQMAGYHDAPEVWLDLLSDAATGARSLPEPDAIIDALLPYAPDRGEPC